MPGRLFRQFSVSATSGVSGAGLSTFMRTNLSRTGNWNLIKRGYPSGYKPEPELLLCSAVLWLMKIQSHLKSTAWKHVVRQVTARYGPSFHLL
jgi:hypothetical protein